ncbi:hypothetical protein [Massilia eburnea]|uniref:hypothetical protein n=1 Tax=Massilia eburnea TaxID=1776165 RepID=UPI001E3AA9B0|nr:hypothetical protein [Massilia eburnea]
MKPQSIPRRSAVRWLAARRLAVGAALRAAASAAIVPLVATALPAAAVLSASAVPQAKAAQAASAAQAHNDKAAPGKGEFTFVLLGHNFGKDGGDAEVRRMLAEADRTDPAFIIATGIKSAGEPCTDRLYEARRDLMNSAEHPLVLLPAGSDWAECRNSNGKSNATERLNRIRELFFIEPDSLGTCKLALNRQSAIAKFRDYAENTYWEQGNILFVTINVPAKNNHYLSEAGRNSEYEDRMVANRAWLHRAFLTAKRKKLPGMVLVMDGDIGAHVEQGFFARLSQKRDGFTEIRRIVRSQADKYSGQLLLVDNRKQDKAAPAISWNKNVGHLSLGAEWTALRVIPGSASLFTLERD